MNYTTEDHLMRIIIVTIAAGALLHACMPAMQGGRTGLADRQPYVVAAEPAEEAKVEAAASVNLSFSHQLDPESIDTRAIAVVADPDREDDRALGEQVGDGDAAAVGGAFTVSDDGRDVRFTPTFSLDGGTRYGIVVTHRLQSVDHVPFNQTPGDEPTPYVSTFTVTGGAADAGGASGTAEGGETGVDIVERVRPSWMLIGELLYDVSGSDSNGDVFVELIGEAGGDVTGYELAFVNGADGKIYDTAVLPDDLLVPDDGILLIADAMTGSPGVTQVVGADHVVNFDPQNGPDAIQLRDADGALIDALGYGEPLVATSEDGLAAFEGTPAVDVGSDMSLARVDDIDTDDNSLDFIQLDTPTPGALEQPNEGL